MSAGLSVLNYHDVRRLWGSEGNDIDTSDRGETDESPLPAPPTALPPEWKALLAYVPSLGLSDLIKKVDADGLESLLGEMQSLITAGQGKVSGETIKLSSAQRKDTQEKAKQQLEIAKQKAKEAEENAKQANILGWVQAIAGLILAAISVAAAFAASVFTLGGAIVLGVAAVIGLTMAIQDTVNMGLKQGHVMTTDALGKQVQAGCSFADMAMAIQKGLVNDGLILEKRSDGSVVDKSGKVLSSDEIDAATKKGARVMTADDLSKEAFAWGIALEVIMVVIAIACGIGGAKLVEKSVEKGVDAAAKVAKANKSNQAFQVYTQGANFFMTGVSAATGFALGGMQAAKVVIQKEKADAEANQRFYDSEAKRIQAAIEGTQEFVQQLVDALGQMYDDMSQTIKEMGETTATVGQNLYTRG